jgi:predicted DCC family thiol-disulfide oxidoreductase YuxK
MAATIQPSSTIGTAVMGEIGTPDAKSATSPARERASLTVLYDGTCGFCTRQARFAQRMAGKHVQLASTADPDVLARYPGLTTQATNRQMYVHEAPPTVGTVPAENDPSGALPNQGEIGGLRDSASTTGESIPGGRMYGGAAAVARLVREVPIIGPLGWLYYVPGIRQLADAGYRLVARNRHRLGQVLGWQPLPNDSCADGVCALPQRSEAS